MLLSRLVKKRLNKNKSPSDAVGCVIPMVIIILIAAGIIRLLSNFTEPAPIPLLTQTNGMVQLVHVEDISKYSQTPVTIPEETFGAELYVIGVYTQDNNLLPKDTVALVYARDGWRYVEIDFKPILIEEQLLTANGFKGDEVVLFEGITGTFFHRRLRDQCIESLSETFPGKCVITHQLYFPLGDIVVGISADGDHATEGEMIEIARSMVSAYEAAHNEATEE